MSAVIDKEIVLQPTSSLQDMIDMGLNKVVDRYVVFEFLNLFSQPLIELNLLALYKSFSI